MSGWQGKPSVPREDVSERFVARRSLLTALRTYLAHGTTGNREHLVSALSTYDRAFGPD